MALGSTSGLGPGQIIELNPGGNAFFNTFGATASSYVHLWNEDQLHPRELTPLEWLEDQLYLVKERAWL